MGQEGNVQGVVNGWSEVGGSAMLSQLGARPGAHMDEQRMPPKRVQRRNCESAAVKASAR